LTIKNNQCKNKTNKQTKNAHKQNTTEYVK